MKVKNILLIFMCLSMSLVYSQRKPKIKGNKAVIDVREELPAFNAIELNDDLDIHLEKSSAVGYNIHADDNLIDVLKFEVVDSTLVISSFYKITSKKKLDITVNYRDLNAITMREGKIVMQDVIVTDDLTVDMFGSSNLELNANASVMHINMEGNSKGNFNLDGDSLNIVLKDRINLDMYSVSEKNSITMYKNASAKMDGTTDTLNVKLYENGNLKAQKLEAAVVNASIESTTNARIYAFRDLNLSSRGSAKIYLYGNPKITILEFLNTSELYKRED